MTSKEELLSPALVLLHIAGLLLLSKHVHKVLSNSKVHAAEFLLGKITGG